MKNTELKIFNYGNTNVRTTVRNGEIWFVLKDVCEVLGIHNSKMVATRLDDDEKAKVSQTDLRNEDFEIPNRGLTIINEPGLYKVISRSDKPEAKKFMRWVTHEVLPSIRKHGAYFTNEKFEQFMNDPETWIKMAQAIQKERAEKSALQERVSDLEGKIEEDKPRVLFANAVAVSDTTIFIGDLAKILKSNGIDIGRNRLLKQLRDDGFLLKKPATKYNMPSQKAMSLGLFKIKETVVAHSNGSVTVKLTAKLTGQGQIYFVNYFTAKEKSNVPQTADLFMGLLA